MLGALFVVASTVASYNFFVSLDREIHNLRQELGGLALIQSISRTLQVVQQCRGLSAALIGGDKTVQQALAAKEREADEAFNTLEGSLPVSLTSSEDWRSIQANWKYLHEGGLHWTVDENFSAHTHLIDRMLDFEAISGDEYILNLNSEPGTFYLIDTAINKLPHALEHLGQIRAYGTGVLTKRRAAEYQKANLNTLITELSDALKALGINLKKTGRYNPAMQKSLSAASKDIGGSSQRIVDLVQSDILTGHFTTLPLDFLMMTTTAIDKGYMQLYESLLPAAETLIKARLTRAENALYLSIGIFFLMALVIVYFAVGIYCSIVDSVRSLSRSAHNFAGGDMRERVNLDTRDELSQIGNSFNEMADGFSTLLAGRKQAEELLAKENYKNETLLRTASDSIYIFDLNGDVVQVNDAFCRMLGYTKEEALAMNVAQWNAQWSAAELKEILSGLKFSNPIFETMHRRRDGSMINVEISTAKVEIDGQQLVFCAARNITLRKQAENALLKSKDLLRSIVENTPVCIFWKDRNSRYLGCNTQFAKDAGYSSPDELIGKTDFEMSYKDQAELYRTDDKAVMESGIPKLDYEEYLTTPEGKMVWIRTSKVPLRDEDNVVIGILGIYKDITEQRKAEQELHERGEKMEQLLKQEIATQTAAAIAHELNQPLLAIAACSDAALRTFESAGIDKEQLSQSLILNKEQAIRAGESLRHLFSVLHDQIPVAEVFDLNLQIQNSLDEFRKRNMLQFHEELKLESELPLVHASRLHIQMVTINLLRNSIEAMQAASIPTSELTMTVRTIKDGNMAQVTILDNGPGLQAREMEHIFDAFYTTKPTGIGMGLKISRSLIKANGGNLWAESTSGRGTAFHFTLPLAS
ncbi:MAG TPA: PAS domain S-box protein [Gallionella sp.]|nr:PAS domain S-box protein [Gallionella sp.]